MVDETPCHAADFRDRPPFGLDLSNGRDSLTEEGNGGRAHLFGVERVYVDALNYRVILEPEPDGRRTT